MKRYLSVPAVVLAFLLGTMPGCVGERPFLMVQLCLRDDHDVSLFKDAMKSIAHTERMDFVDGGAVTQKELMSSSRNPPYRLIYIGIKGENGVGMEAGNLGLSEYEVAMGFSEGSSPADARRFANMVVGVLKRSWRVYFVPSGRGAVPVCTGNTKQKR